jgi:hypothetical protein
VNYGQSAITSANIITAAGAPFISYKLPSLRPGFACMQVFVASGTFVLPNGVTTVRVYAVGGGGGGGYHNTLPSGGGGAAGSSNGIVGNLTPGQSISVTVGAGGAVLTTYGIGNAGGVSSFGSYLGGNGGSGGGGGTTAYFANSGGAGGTGFGGQVNNTGSYGTDSIVVACRGGDGGGPGNGRGTSAGEAGISAYGFGGGGGGGGCSTGSSPVGYAGGAGGPGLVVVEY